MEKRQELYAGKAKSVYTTDDPDLLVLNFRDDTSAFDGKKMESLARKGMVNNIFNAFIIHYQINCRYKFITKFVLNSVLA